MQGRKPRRRGAAPDGNHPLLGTEPTLALMRDGEAPVPTGTSDPTQLHHSLWPCRVGWQGRLPVEGDRAPKAGDDDVQCGLEEPIRARKRRRLRELGRKRGGSNKQCCQFSRHACAHLLAC